MINSLLFFLILIPTSLASGAVELIVSSSETVAVETTVCADFECPGPDDNSPARKVAGGVPLRFQTGVYKGEARENVDLYLKVVDTKNNAITMKHFRPPTATTWNVQPIVVKLTGFNVTVQLRNLCNTNYHGERCGRFCLASKDRHWECSNDGRRQCSAGWSGSDCSIPTCSAGCNGRGRCVAPERCECAIGYNGTQCEQCVPTEGCVHGKCRNGMPMTCECLPGFVGAKCDIDVNICSAQKPCLNSGVCSLDTSSGFRCECPFGFFGPRCETPLSSVRCADNAEHVCRNGGTCISMDSSSFQCKCPSGFSGRFCEVGKHKDCSTKQCSAGARCQMMEAQPMCISTTQRPPTVVVINNHHHYPKNDEKEELWNNWLLVVCVLSCVIGVILATRLIYVNFIADPSRRRLASTESTLPTTTTPTKPKSSPVYKVCIIDAENATSSSECGHHCPPPAYSSPVIPRLYKSIPTHDLEHSEPKTHSFRDSNV